MGRSPRRSSPGRAPGTHPPPRDRWQRPAADQLARGRVVAPAAGQRRPGVPMIVAIESASSDPSLALATSDGAAFAADGWAGEGRQASELLPRLLELLARSGRELGETTALTIGVGPGSFTGLRVSMSL